MAIAASGGKDSTVLAYVLKLLNEKYHYGLNLVLLSIDEGITGYRDDSLDTVKQNRDDYDMPLKIMSYKDLYGWTMDEIVAEVGILLQLRVNKQRRLEFWFKNFKSQYNKLDF